MIGRSRLHPAVLGLMALLGLASAAAGQPPAKRWTAPRTSWGDPDVRGVWPLDSLGRTPLQRPVKYGEQAYFTDAEYKEAQAAAAKVAAGADTEDKEGKLGAGHWFEYGQVLRQTSLIVEPANGRLPPLTEKGKALAASMRSSWTQTVFEGPEDFNSLDRCITRGLTASMIPFPYNNGLRIFQSPGYVVMQLELIHERRIIPLDGRPQLPGVIRPWLGSSRGHFEGDTLVIDTTNFTGATPMAIVSSRATSVPTSASMHVVERLTPVGPNTIQYEATVSDPDVLTAPWKMSFPWTRNDKYVLYEYACHEGNTVVPAYIRSTSPRYAEERRRNGGIAEGLTKPAELGSNRR